MLNMNFHILKINIFPFSVTILFMIMFNSIINLVNMKLNFFFIVMIFFFIIIMLANFMNILLLENMMMGCNSIMKEKINSLGFFLFILSETMIFISLFWSYIHNGFTINQYMGNFWPPKGIEPSNPTGMIIFGTSILLSSSLIIMYFHNLLIILNYKKKSNIYLLMTLFMGILFTDMQILEMSNYMLKLNFNFNDSVFSNSFLFTTSLHASHVMIGMMMLFLTLIFYNNIMNSKKFYLSMEMSIWYWHFVDYIWIIVFSLFYYLNV